MDYQPILIAINNFQLLIVIVSTILFSLFYSFIIAKRNELITRSDNVKLDRSDLHNKQRMSFCVAYINNYKDINIGLFILIITSITLWIGTIIILSTGISLSSFFAVIWMHFIVNLIFLGNLSQIYKNYKTDTQL